MKPALSAEEWREVLLDGPPVHAHHSVHEEDKHYVAALCLYGQEFGFTREMALVIRQHAQFYDLTALRIKGKDVPGLPTVGSVFSAVADRIEALLPPEGSL